MRCTFRILIDQMSIIVTYLFLEYSKPFARAYFYHAAQFIQNLERFASHSFVFAIDFAVVALRQAPNSCVDSFAYE